MSNEYDYNQDRSEDNTVIIRRTAHSGNREGRTPRKIIPAAPTTTVEHLFPAADMNMTIMGSMVVPVSPRKVIPTLRPILWPPIM